ncbi:unnamed protein product [Sordaria macrospora k-hell]|uniref:WGS project CABT00000000 data, contig 2.2 n=1 Tax=Sordaria macrospora (strain ATCC MYA-333 / DSM 997 / K(L3346) / K-hell) TaxID=771870 RepID=F7VM98_SORMK|nr:uncharacterized protein SMAC_01102 [Sordaria macrospora k-hell]CCC07078.1 unnamed protein product [Sordaria macrospora k-hell]
MDQESSSQHPKGHQRTRSAVKATRPRSSTKGPLDVDDTRGATTSHDSRRTRTPAQDSRPRLSTSPPIPGGPLPRPAPLSPSTAALVPISGWRSQSAHVHLPLAPGGDAPYGRGAPRPPPDFSHLLRPDIYHELTPLNVPPPFRQSVKQPSASIPIPNLLAGGHFRAAAVAAAQALTGANGAPAPDPVDHALILSLFYVRLACLTLIDATVLATQEVKALEDLNAAFYIDATGHNLIPWELRVLAVRLQAMSFADQRRAVMSYYDLAREARLRLAEAAAKHDNSEKQLWRERLNDLGVRVAGVLVEMDDLKGAVEHLASLKETDSSSGKMQMARALLWLHLGDVDAARKCVKPAEGSEGPSDDMTERIMNALCDMADGKYSEALSQWEELSKVSDDEMVGVNRGVCLLYVGRLQEGKNLLESLVDSGRTSHTLLFNLTTMYELCTERSRTLKIQLTEKVAALEPTAFGWEKTNVDFKL